MATHSEEVTVKLREMIVTRELPPGSRVPERDLAALLGVSRTPVRAALGILAAEGLVIGEPHRGFVVRPFSYEDVLSAYDVRSVLEGLAVRTAVERGIGLDTLQKLESCVAEGEALVASSEMNDEEMRRWSTSNALFHGTLLDAAGLSALHTAHASVSRLPLAAPIAIMFTDYKREVARGAMAEAHEDHVHLLESIRRGESTRAEFMMREHVLRSRDNLGRMLREQLHRLDHNLETSKRWSRVHAD